MSLHGTVTEFASGTSEYPTGHFKALHGVPFRQSAVPLVVVVVVIVVIVVVIVVVVVVVALVTSKHPSEHAPHVLPFASGAVLHQRDG
mmetsp:Transcript_132230/g.229957  ORF Transcript_132230/g.229957 Transcript_132230/m.229957 type:complete len:88 (-) Transcript_132230:6-269(-)